MNLIRPSILLLIVLFVASSPLRAQYSDLYLSKLNNYHETKLNVKTLKTQIEQVAVNGTLTENTNVNAVIELPMPEGDFARFRVVEAPMMSADLSQRLPAFKTYSGQGIDDPTATVKFSVTPAGFSGIVLGINGMAIIKARQTDMANRDYISYYDHDIISENNKNSCEAASEVDGESSGITPLPSLSVNSCFAFGDQLRTYDIVLTCSGEFYTLNGNTVAGAQAALLNRMMQISAVYEKEMAISFNITQYLINDPSTDPYSDPTNTSTSLNETADFILANATAPYDLGHGFHEITCGGGCGWAGRAGLGVVCRANDNTRARGYTYLPNDIPNNIVVVLHEFGHMFSCVHTNYGCNSSGICGRYEPGRGTSIMSTGAGCDAGDTYDSRTDYFGIGSLQSIATFITTGELTFGSSCNTFVPNDWTNCPTLSPTGNTIPTSDADANNIDGLTIPNNTPFTLSGSGTDPDNNTLTYNWEQFDTDFAGSAAPDDTGASTTAPIFRTFPPSTSTERTLPQLSSILAGNVTAGTGEILPTVARTLTWRLTVRDNAAGGGGIACDEIFLNVGNDGPFQVSSQNASTAWFENTSETITWDVAGTNAPVYTCSMVDILYSTDGGQTFPTVLASGVINNGSQNITVPAGTTNAGRVKIVCSGGTNIFFDINDTDIAVIAGCTADGGTIANAEPVAAPEGDASLALTLQAGVLITTNGGTLDNNDPSTTLAVNDDEVNSTADCINFGGNNPRYETLTLVAGTTGDYTLGINASGYTGMVTLYQNSYFAGKGCTDWLNSNGSYNGTNISISSGFTENLQAGDIYVLVNSGFRSNNTIGTYSNTISGPGSLYSVGNFPDTGYEYVYITVDDNNNIVAITADADLSNATIFPEGSYTIYGLTKLGGSDLSSYIGASFASLSADINDNTVCGDLSSNNVPVIIQAALPVELISFTGKVVANAHQLDWQIATEIDNDYFTLERSADGRNFTEISRITGVGNTTTTQRYQYLDKLPLVGKNYYRLKQTDFDGQSEYIGEVILLEKAANTGIRVQPNPIKGEALLASYTTDQPGNLSLMIYDMNGQQVKTHQVSVLAGTNILKVGLTEIPSGVYLVRTVLGDKIFTERFVKTN